MFPTSEILSFFKLLATSGLAGGRGSHLFHLFDIGGTEARNISKVLRHCSGAHNERSMSHSVLSALACHLKGRIDDGVVSLMPVYERVLAQLASFDLTEVEGGRVRSRVKWAEEGETSSRFFLRLEKKRGTESWISAIRVSSGVVVADVEGICESWASFYQDLFTACPVDLGVQSDLLDCRSFSFW